MAGKTARRMPVSVRGPIVITVVVAGLFASSSLWGLTGSGGGGHRGGPRGRGESGSSTGQQTDRMHGGGRDSESADHGSGGDPGYGSHGLRSRGTLTFTAPTTL